MNVQNQGQRDDSFAVPIDVVQGPISKMGQGRVVRISGHDKDIHVRTDKMGHMILKDTPTEFPASFFDRFHSKKWVIVRVNIDGKVKYAQMIKEDIKGILKHVHDADILLKQAKYDATELLKEGFTEEQIGDIYAQQERNPEALEKAVVSYILTVSEGGEKANGALEKLQSLVNRHPGILSSFEKIAKKIDSKDGLGEFRSSINFVLGRLKESENPELAFIFYEKAANGGHPEAAFKFAQMLDKKSLVNKTLEERLDVEDLDEKLDEVFIQTQIKKYYTMAADKGNATAQNRLGEISLEKLRNFIDINAMVENFFKDFENENAKEAADKLAQLTNDDKSIIREQIFDSFIDERKSNKERKSNLDIITNNFFKAVENGSEKALENLKNLTNDNRLTAQEQVEVLFKLEKFHESHGHLDSAAECFYDAIRKDESQLAKVLESENNLDILFALEKKFSEIGNDKDASKFANKAFFLKSNADFLNILGNNFSEMGNYENAIKFYQKAIEKGSAEAFQKLEGLKSNNDLTPAEKVEVLFILERLYENRKDFKLAAQCFYEAIQIDKSQIDKVSESVKNPYILNILWNKFSDIGNYGFATKFYNKVDPKTTPPIDIENYKEAADLGHVIAQLEVAEMYKLMKPASYENMKNAIEYYSLAASKGSSKAFYELGQLLLLKEIPYNEPRSKKNSYTIEELPNFIKLFNDFADPKFFFINNDNYIFKADSLIASKTNELLARKLLIKAIERGNSDAVQQLEKIANRQDFEAMRSLVSHYRLNKNWDKQNEWSFKIATFDQSNIPRDHIEEWINTKKYFADTQKEILNSKKSTEKQKENALEKLELLGKQKDFDSILYLVEYYRSIANPEKEKAWTIAMSNTSQIFRVPIGPSPHKTKESIRKSKTSKELNRAVEMQNETFKEKQLNIARTNLEQKKFDSVISTLNYTLSLFDKDLAGNEKNKLLQQCEKFTFELFNDTDFKKLYASDKSDSGIKKKFDDYKKSLDTLLANEEYLIGMQKIKENPSYKSDGFKNGINLLRDAAIKGHEGALKELEHRAGKSTLDVLTDVYLKLYDSSNRTGDAGLAEKSEFRTKALKMGEKASKNGTSTSVIAFEKMLVKFGDEYSKQGNLSEAVLYYIKATVPRKVEDKKFHTSDEAFIRLGNLLRKNLNNPNKAPLDGAQKSQILQVLEKNVNRMDSDFIHLQLGEIYQLMNKPEKAIEHYLIIANHKTNRSDIIGKAYLGIGKLYSDSALKIQPSKASVLHLLEICEKKKEKKEKDPIAEGIRDVREKEKNGQLTKEKALAEYQKLVAIGFLREAAIKGNEEAKDKLLEELRKSIETNYSLESLILKIRPEWESLENLNPEDQKVMEDIDVLKAAADKEIEDLEEI